MNPRLQRFSDDPDAREALATQAIRRNDMATLQQLANEDPARARLMARRLVDAGWWWTAYAVAHSPKTRTWPVEFPDALAQSIGSVFIRRPGRGDDHLFVSVPWDDRKRRLFACDCAERALLVSTVTDLSPREAIRLARRFANGIVSPDALRVAWGEVPERAEAPWDIDRTALAAVWSASTQLRAIPERGVALDAARYGSRAAGLFNAVGTYYTLHDHFINQGEQQERVWQRERLLQYLLDEVTP